VQLDEDDPIKNPIALPEWTMYRALKVSVSIHVDLLACRRDLGIDDEAQLALQITWLSPGTGLRGASDLFAITNGNLIAALTIDPGLTNTSVKLECHIVLAQSSASPSDLLAPTRVGSLLWQSDYAIRLEGDAARMPILPLPFSSWLGASSDASMWSLRVTSSDLDSPAQGALWLWINTENEYIAGMLLEPDSPKSLTVAYFMQADFLRQLIIHGIAHDEVELDKDYVAGSLGAVIVAALRLLDSDMQELRSRYTADPQLFDTDVQARVGGI
jgi:hypothetical protein